MNKIQRDKSFIPCNTKFGVFLKKYLRDTVGFTYIEMVAVIAILVVLLGVAIIATRQVKSNDLDMAAELVQSALVEAREKAQSPRPSTPLDEPSDVNGYGVRFRPDGNEKQFQVFKDIVDTPNPENENKWVDPNTTLIDDEIITTYKFADNNIVNVENNELEKSDSGIESGSDLSIIFKTSEIPSQRLMYFNGDSNLDWVKVRLRNIEDDSLIKDVKVDFDSGEVKIESVVSFGGETVVSLWTFEEGLGIIAGDSIGNNDGILRYDDGGGEQDGDGSTVGPIWTTDAYSGSYALRFNRGAISDTGDFVRIPDSASLDISGDLTIDFWAKFPGDLDSKQAMVGKCEGYASYSVRINQEAARRVSFKFEAIGKSWPSVPDREPWRYIVTNNNVEINNTDWFHIVAVKNGTEMRLYVNDDEAVLTNVTPYNDDPEEFLNSYDLFLGGDPRGSIPPGTLDYPFDGIIDEVRIY